MRPLSGEATIQQRWLQANHIESGKAEVQQGFIFEATGQQAQQRQPVSGFERSEGQPKEKHAGDFNMAQDLTPFEVEHFVKDLEDAGSCWNVAW